MIENRIRFRVRYVETDQMGIAHHSNYFAWFECGRTELMRDLGYPYTQMEKEGILMPIVNVACKYFRPAHYDDLLELRTMVKELPRARITLNYIITKVETGETLAEGETTLAFLNEKRRPTRAPEKFLNTLRSNFK
ncbi:MAG TPA: acyl-CoA thioesterase [Bacteroidetes bacterium]|nr:acyl-CoA thioesterase [Bacteroidota bacterium]